MLSRGVAVTLCGAVLCGCDSGRTNEESVTRPTLVTRQQDAPVTLAAAPVTPAPHNASYEPEAPELPVKELVQVVPEKVWPEPLADAAPIQFDENLLRKNYYVVLDGSGSMEGTNCAGKETKATVAKRALSQFVSLVPEGAFLGLIAFNNEGVRELVPLSSDRARFVNEVRRLKSSGDTPLREAIAKARTELETQARRQRGYGEYYLVVVTDGEASPGQDPRDEVNRIVNESPIVVHTIGFCIGTTHSLNQPGKTVYRPANNPAQLSEGLQAVLAEAPAFDVAAFKKEAL